MCEYWAYTGTINLSGDSSLSILYSPTCFPPDVSYLHLAVHCESRTLNYMVQFGLIQQVSFYVFMLSTTPVRQGLMRVVVQHLEFILGVLKTTTLHMFNTYWSHPSLLHAVSYTHCTPGLCEVTICTPEHLGFLYTNGKLETIRNPPHTCTGALSAHTGSHTYGPTKWQCLYNMSMEEAWAAHANTLPFPMFVNVVCKNESKNETERLPIVNLTLLFKSTLQFTH